MSACTIAALAACAGSTTPPSRAAAPTPRSVGWSDEGVASWYGPRFHGRPTASGERFDMNAMTAAHRTLPFGTHIEVTNLTNGRTVTVRVNDRGPFAGNRILDLSRAAARELDMLGAGTARVRFTVVTEPVECFDVQVGAFRNAESADDLAASLRAVRQDVRVERGDDGISRVLLGPFDSRHVAAAERDEVDGVLRAC